MGLASPLPGGKGPSEFCGLWENDPIQGKKLFPSFSNSKDGRSPGQLFQKIGRRDSHLLLLFDVQLVNRSGELRREEGGGRGPLCSLGAELSEDPR